MSKKINIADAELPVMKVIWEHDNLTSPEIYAYLNGNKNTFKTLLQRLVAKNIVKSTQINARTFRYTALVSREEYTKSEQRGFIKRVFDGSKEKMLLNFVKEENITKEDLQRLLDMIEEE